MTSGSRKSEKDAQSKVTFEPLEPRVLLSAALPAVPMDIPAVEAQNLYAIDIEADIELNATANESLGNPTSGRGNYEILYEISVEENKQPPAQPAEIAEETAAKELVIVDTSISNFHIFLDEIILDNNYNRIFEVVTIDANRNGIDQIGDILSGYVKGGAVVHTGADDGQSEGDIDSLVGCEQFYGD